MKKRKCYNCKFASSQFKIVKLTHLHCEDPKRYSREAYERGEFTSPWETLRVFSDTCSSHQFK
jgi:hypothetical protein